MTPENPQTSPSHQPPPKSRWDKADILLKGLSVPIVGGMLSWFATDYLKDREARDTNYRAFAELVSQREQAETELRKSMFSTVLDSFLKKEPGTLDERILKLEILAYNFHESFDLGPIFHDVRDTIGRRPDGQRQLKRLQRLASQVIYKQVESLTADIGVSRTGNVDFEELERSKSGLEVLNTVMRLRPLEEQRPEDHPERRFLLQVVAPDPDRGELEVRLIVSRPGQTDPTADQTAHEVDTTFHVGAFDFPSIDNTRLSNGERCAVVLDFMEKHSASLTLVYFPASRAGLKDRAYIDELLREMLRVRTSASGMARGSVWKKP